MNSFSPHAPRHPDTREPRGTLVVLASRTGQTLFLTALLLASACGDTDTGTTTGSNASGGTAGGGGTGATSGSGTTGGSAGRAGSGGFTGCPPCAAPPGPNCVGSGPCGCGPFTCADAGSPSGSCGGVQCGPGTSCCGPAECGRCVPDTSGIFCPDYCEFCSGKYQRFEHSTMCSGDQSAQWEIIAMPLTPFQVPACRDLVTNLPRYCCTADFRPVCP
jgi:hypothetical protein